MTADTGEPDAALSDKPPGEPRLGAEYVGGFLQRQEPVNSGFHGFARRTVNLGGPRRSLSGATAVNVRLVLHDGERAHGRVYPVTLEPGEQGRTMLRWTILPHERAASRAAAEPG